MRFNNWDVILLPQDSEIPIPEFKVEAFCADDVEAATIHSVFDFPNQGMTATAALSTPPGSSDVPGSGLQQAPLGYAQMPLLSCFVPSLSVGTAFRVSVHHWERIPFAFDDVVVNVLGRIPCCQVRVFVDGNLVSDGIIKSETIWPLQIDTGYSANPKLCRGYLRWPKFYEDQLSQNFWSPKEDHGRIKIVISEGIMNQATGYITRTKNIISFAFHHAPLKILQGASIAWPNERLWLKPDFFTPNNLEGNGYRLVNVLEENTNANHEAARDHFQHSAQPLPDPQTSEIPARQPSTTAGTTQTTSTKTNPLANKQTTRISLNTPAQLDPQTRGSPVRKKRATEDKVNPPKTVQQTPSRTKPKPAARGAAEKIPVQKMPAKTPTTTPAKAPAKAPTKTPVKILTRARQAPAKKTVSTAPPPAPASPEKESEDEESGACESSTEAIMSDEQDEEEDEEEEEEE